MINELQRILSFDYTITTNVIFTIVIIITDCNFYVTNYFYITSILYLLLLIIMCMNSNKYWMKINR